MQNLLVADFGLDLGESILEEMKDVGKDGGTLGKEMQREGGLLGGMKDVEERDSGRDSRYWEKWGMLSKKGRVSCQVHSFLNHSELIQLFLPSLLLSSVCLLLLRLILC